MLRLYSGRSHEQALAALSREYDARLKELRDALAELKEENRRLSAENSLLRAQKQSISDAMIAASEKKEEMQTELNAFLAAQKALAVQAAEKAQTLLEDVRAAYPDEETSARFSAFERRLKLLFEADGTEEAIAVSDGEGDDFAAYAEPAAASSSEADGQWDLKAVFEILGLSDD